MKAPRKCAACSRTAARGKLRCHPCIYAAEKARRPVEVAYRQLKSNAKRRGKPFSISVAYFSAFCFKTKLLIGRGKTGESLSVDCIIEELGYVEGNLQPLTLAANTAKSNEYRKIKKREYDYETRQGWTREIGESPKAPAGSQQAAYDPKNPFASVILPSEDDEPPF